MLRSIQMLSRVRESSEDEKACLKEVELHFEANPKFESKELQKSRIYIFWVRVNVSSAL